ncbi:MAG: xylulose kinase, partial [Leptospiraceae bacterium]|nr:xylulose kinase [Leptospiraceae bacterium]
FYADDELQTEKPADALKRFNQIAARIPAGSEGLIFLPWLYGERTPVEDHHVRGGFYNLALNMHRGHMIRAAFEGVAYNSRWLFQAVEAFIKRPMSHLNIIGGGALSDLWCQIMADVLQRKIRRIKDPIQANARGAGLLGAVALGKMSVPHIADRIQVEREFEPIDANVTVYNEMYREYENIYKKNRAIFARLNRKRFDG